MIHSKAVLRICIALAGVVLGACSQGSDIKIPSGSDDVVLTREQNIQAIVAGIAIPSAGRMTFQGVTLMDLSSPAPVTTVYGTVTQGTTLNYLKINGVDFVVYGEDGAFAAECEAHASYPDHGPGHTLCSVLHAETFDQVILCTPTAAGAAIEVAQNWPGVPQAMSTAVGMRCWHNGVEQTSQKFFTY